MHFAIVFKKAFEPGDHWNPAAAETDSDRVQYWQKGDLYSLSSTKPEKLPFHLEVVEIDGPPENGDVWDRTAKRFAKWHENETFLADQIQAHSDAISQHERERTKLLTAAADLAVKKARA